MKSLYRFFTFAAGILGTVSLAAQDPILVINEKKEEIRPAITVTLTGERLEQIKDINGANGAASMKYGDDPLREEYFKPLQIPIIRAHDLPHHDPGLHPCDLDHIFPIETADPSKRENYDFSVTDEYVRMVYNDLGTKIMWRLGSSIENMDEYHYETHPPKSNKAWAESAANVIEHYTNGKWDGFHYDIEYWEIWNEPDNKHCWTGTQEEFFDLYITAATYLKKRFPHLKIGGPALCSSRNKWVKPFIEACAEAEAPLDFFSYHGYVYKEGDDSGMVHSADELRGWLDAAGFTKTEIFYDEWHPINGWTNTVTKLTPDRACLTASIMLGFQDVPIDKAFFYTATSSRWGVISNGKLEPVYYTIKAVGDLRAHPTRIGLKSSNMPDGARALAGIDEKGDVDILLATYKSGKREINFDFSAMGQFARGEIYIYDENNKLERVACVDKPNGRMQVNTLCNSVVALLKLYKKAPEAKDESVTITATGQTAGKIKPLNCGNHGPALKSYSIHFKTKYFGNMKIPYIRLNNEVRENSGLKLVNTNQIFPLKDADPTKKEFYDFRATDDYIAQIINYGGAKPFYCLSNTDERLINRMHFRIDKPQTDKWCTVCENIIRHYNEGKWDGFRHNIEYWEIWAEPDNPHFWSASFEDYIDLYIQAAKHLKSCFPKIKVGGPSLNAYSQEKAAAFIAACKAAGAPIDFFSYMEYKYEKGEYNNIIHRADGLRKLLDDNGFKNTEIIVSAWHPAADRENPWPTNNVDWTTLYSSIMLHWQDSPIDKAMFDAVSNNGWGVYNTPNPNSRYYMFIAMADLMEHPIRLELKSEGLSETSAAVAGKNEKGDTDVVISLHGVSTRSTVFDFSTLGKFSNADIYLMDRTRPELTKVSSYANPDGKAEISNTRPDALILVKLKK